MYFKRLIDKHLENWANAAEHKPLLLRGARQVGKSCAVRHLGERFEHLVEINLEKHPEYKAIFAPNLDVTRIVPQLSAMTGKPIIPGKTLLFLDEIQECQEAIMSLRFFKEDTPDLHVVAAGSLLEFALNEIPTFGVGRIHSMFMHPMSFDEFLEANGQQMLLEARRQSSAKIPLPTPLHEKLVQQFRTYMMVGGMPEAVGKWVQSNDYLECQAVQDDILVSYEDDFSKYKKKVDPQLLRQTFRSIAAQVTKKFTYSKVGDYRADKIREALKLLVLAGLAIPVTQSCANGLPLGSEADSSNQKILLLDSGLLLRLQNLNLGSVSETVTQILTANEVDLVNKGTLAEMIAGLELLRYKTPNMRHELYYWTRAQKNSTAEIDYLDAINAQITPIEIKAGTRGGMKSLWLMMREKGLTSAYRCSLENFGEFYYSDTLDNGSVRHVEICPLYALSQIGTPTIPNLTNK